MTQSTQYDDLASSWKDVYSGNLDEQAEQFPAALAEAAQLKIALLQDSQPLVEDLPDIRGKHVLDLATGSGHYARLYLKWGAASVTGVDISGGMVEEARAESKRDNIPSSKLSFEVGDVADPKTQVTCSNTADGLFDIVAAGWLLNYASDAADMKGMFETVARHLRPGGFFVGLTIPPLSRATGDAEHDKETLNAEAAILGASLKVPNGAHALYGESGYVIGPVKDGLKVHINLWQLNKGEAGSFGSFDNYYLRENVFADAIRQTGAFENDELVWQETVVTQDMYDQVKPFGRTRAFWNRMKMQPWCRTCVARRKAQ